MAGNNTVALRSTTARIIAIVVMVVLGCLAAVLAAPDTALANRQLEAPTTVADDITRLQVNKLDADTHEPVTGAKMVIVDESGNAVAEWVSDGSGFSIEKGLDVNVTYTLKELDPPDGYSAITPIVFRVDPIEGNGIIIESGDKSQYDLRITFESLATGVHSVLNLYDKADATENVITVTETRAAPARDGGTTKAVAPKTGDETPIILVAVLVIIGIAAIAALEVPKRRMNKQ